MWLDPNGFFNIKYNSNGSIGRLKASLVPKGYTQLYRLDFNDTFSSAVRACIVHIVLSIAVSHGWNIHQFHVKNTLLHDLPQEEATTRIY